MLYMAFARKPSLSQVQAGTDDFQTVSGFSELRFLVRMTVVAQHSQNQIWLEKRNLLKTRMIPS